MAKIAAGFYEIPPWLERINRLQQQLSILTEPLYRVCSDYYEMTKNINAILNSPAIQDAFKVARLATPGVIAAVQQTQDMLSKIYTPELLSMIRQQQKLMASIVPSDLQAQLTAQVQEWSCALFDTAPCSPEPLSTQKMAELSRLSDLAAEYAPKQEINPTQALTEDEQQIVVSEVAGILSDKNWEQRFAECVKKFSQTHPVIAWILQLIFLPIILGVIINHISPTSGQTVAPAKVYELPQSSSPVVCHIKQEQTVIIIDEVPYYYGIELTDDATGQRQAGYVSKRSILLISAREEPATINDEVDQDPRP